MPGVQHMVSKALQLANENLVKAKRLTRQKAPSGSEATEALSNNAEECRKGGIRAPKLSLVYANLV